MSIDFGGTTNIKIGGTTYMSVDTSGRVLQPYQPAFCARDGAGSTVGNYMRMQTVVFDIGGGYNTGNGLYTAPVAGKYYFRFQQLAPNADAGEFRSCLFKNGVRYMGLSYITTKPAGTWWSLVCDGHVDMAVNDYVGILYETGVSAMYTDGNYSSFSGHLT
jgi:hypothetical protein